MGIAKSGTGKGYAWEVVEWPEGTMPWRSDPVAFCPDYARMTPESQVSFLKSLDDMEDRREKARRDMKQETKKPNPGSKDAIALGCTCPVMDNNYGRGEAGSFWITFGCPIHHKEPEVICKPSAE